MQYLKNLQHHYEKLILGVVLLLMAASVVLLGIEVSGVQGELKDIRDTFIPAEAAAAPKLDLDQFRKVLTSSRAPRALDLSAGHRVFNPDLWLINADGEMFSGRDVGPTKLVVTRIVPLPLKFELVVAGQPDKPTYLLSVTREYEKDARLQRSARRSIVLNSTNIFDNVRKIGFVTREIVAEPPDNPTITMDLLEGGVEPQKLTLTKANGFTKVIDYAAELHYPPEGQKFPYPQRRDATLVFAGDTNIIVDIQSGGVIIKAASNEKHTTIPLKKAP